MIATLQIIGVLFAIFALSRVILRTRDRAISPMEGIFWSMIWISIIVVAILPNTATFVSELMGIQRPIDVAVYTAITAMLYLLFRLYVKIDAVERDVTRLVEEIAINDKKK